MKLYIKQKVFCIGDKFSIIDETEQVKYYVEGKLLSIGKKLHVYNEGKQEVSFIKQKIFTFMPTFTIYKNEEEIAEIVKEITFFKDKYIISGLNWTVSGEVFDHDYVINDEQGKEIVKIHKKWISWGDSYEIDVNDEANEVNAISVVLAIDCVLTSRNSIAGSSN